MTMGIDYGRCECECGECAFGRHCHRGDYCKVGHEGPCTCGQCVSPFLGTPAAGPHPPPARVQERSTPAAAPVTSSGAKKPVLEPRGWSLGTQKAKSGKPKRYRVVGPWRSSPEEVERDMKLVAGGRV